ncbi:MAG: hypothetical protein HOP96_10335 [Sphingomonas sp.]|nr:hypothetical protein [Sphingomonas sp.]
MRTHSGRDKARNNMQDPTIRERQSKPKKASITGRTAEMGSRARKTGQKGAGGHR